MHKKSLRRMSAFILSLTLCFSLMPTPALAQGSIDVDADVQLSIHYQYEFGNVEGVPFDLYRVADVSEVNTVFTLCGDFAAAPVLVNNLDAEGWKVAAETLTGYAQSKGAVPLCSGQTDVDGLLIFPTETAQMKAGLYLVVSPQTQIEGYVYTTEPFLVCLPGRNDAENAWDYALTVNPKCVRTEAPVEPPVTSRIALKVWNDQGHESARPNEVTVYLLKNGEPFETVTLSAVNNWQYMWNGLSGAYEWRVVEAEVDKYTTTVTQEGITFVITNTYTVPYTPPDNPPKPPDLPRTGTTWYLVPLLASAGLLCVVLGMWVRKREKRHEA